MTDVERLTGEIQVAERGYASPRNQNLQHEFHHAEAFGHLTPEQRSILEKRDENVGTPTTGHLGTYSSLGFFVPTGFVDMIEQATKYFAPLLDGSVCLVMDTTTGQPLPYEYHGHTTDDFETHCHRDGDAREEASVCLSGSR